MKIEEYMKMENFGMAWTWKFTHGILAPLGLRNFVQVHFVTIFLCGLLVQWDCNDFIMNV